MLPAEEILFVFVENADRAEIRCLEQLGQGWAKVRFLFLHQGDLWDTLEDTSYDITES